MLKRDPSSNAVINTNVEEYRLAKQRRAAALEVQQMKQDISTLSTQMAGIAQILQNIQEKLENNVQTSS